MKVLLINPPLEDFFFTPQRAYPLGILSLGTVLEQAGFEVKILNCLEDYTKKSLPLPHGFAYLARYYKVNLSPFHLFSHYYRFGLSEAHICAQVRDFKPDIVGISCNFSAYLDSAFAVAGLIKQIDSRIAIVAGGRAATFQAETVLKSPDIDFVLRGEAEHSLLNLCRVLNTGKKKAIEGLCYKKNNGEAVLSSDIALIKDINALPQINRTLIDYKLYWYKGQISTSLLASRGCGLRCAFCAITGPFRYRRAEGVLQEIEDCYSLGIRHFNFEDDNMNLNPEFEKVLDGLIDRFRGEVKISFMNGLLSLNLLGRLKTKLIDAGLTHLDLSIASSNKDLRKKINRKESVKDLSFLADYMSKRAIVPTVHYIVGFPDQKIAQAVRDIRFLATKPVILGPSIFYPVIESQMFERLNRDFLFVPQNYSFFRSSVASFDKHIGRDRIFLLFYAARIINYIKELCDEHVLQETCLSDVLKKNARYFRIKGEKLIFREKPNRFLLGVVLLKLLLKEYNIYSIRKEASSKGFLYHIKKEEFVEPLVLKRVLSRLVVRGVGGKKLLFR
ncbi:MAG: cobalamin-dependent protein [Candidatus Omnitrophota bacterium]